MSAVSTHKSPGFLRKARIQKLCCHALLVAVAAVAVRAESLQADIYKVSGEVSIDGQVASEWSPTGTLTEIKTDPDSELIVTLGDLSLIVRSKSLLKLEFSEGRVSRIQVDRGGVFALMAKRADRTPLVLLTPHARLDFKHGAVYAESFLLRSYIDLCEGVAKVTALADNSVERLVSERHDGSRYVYLEHPKGELIRATRPKMHSDRELALLYKIQGRLPEYGNFNGLESRVRRKL